MTEEGADSKSPENIHLERKNAAEIYLTELSERISDKQNLRNKNQAAESDRPDESFFRKLDSSLKKNSAFIKKLKNLSESQRAAIVKDFGALNLTKYVAEIASSIVEVKIKMSDVPVAVEISCLAHQRYAEFSSEMLENWRKVFPTKKKSEKIENTSKLRVDLRLFAELFSLAIFSEKEGLQLLGSVLMYLVTTDKEAGEHRYLPILSAFVKFFGFEYVGVVPRKVRTAAEEFSLPIPTNPQFIASEKQKTIFKLMFDYYSNLVEKVVQDFEAIKKMERKNRHQYLTKGEVFEDAAKRLEEAKSAFEILHKALLILADGLDVDPPDLPDLGAGDEADEGAEMTIQMDMTYRGDGEGQGLWEDEDTRQFYETLPELRTLLPGILFKESEKATLTPLEEKIEEEAGEAIDESIMETDADAEVTEAETWEEEPSTVSGGTLKEMMEGFIASLTTLVNRDMIDNAATDFVTNLNTKTNRKKLARALFAVQRTRLDLLPFYSRLVAILHPVMPDVGTELVQNLKMEFRRLLRKKDQIKVESKIKNVRFIGELCKFKIYPKSEALHCYKMMLFDFRHHAIDMAAAFLDVAGYFLYHSPDSHQKTKLLLEEMMRKKEVGALDQRYQLMIDNAYYHCNPPAGSGTIVKIERPPMHDFLRKILFFDLSKATAVKTLRYLRKIDWTDSDTANYAIQCFSLPGMVKFGCIQYLASILAAIMSCHDWVGHQVVDNILEDIRLGLEVNHPKLNQRRISAIKYLGEMYNYRVVDSGIIFGILYSLITMGTAADGSSPLDPPDHLFRIRLVCVLLETCGCFFDKGSAAKKLDCFLAYFQRYYWQKKSCAIWKDEGWPFPIEADNLMLSLRDLLRPNLTLHTDLPPAEEAVKKIEDEYREKLESMLSFQNTEENAETGFEGEDEDGLAPIQEADEEDEDERAASSQDQGYSQEMGRSPVEEEGDYSDEETFEGDDEEEEEEEEQVTVHRSASTEQRTAEDDEFIAAFDKMMHETVQERIVAAPKVQQVDIVLPTNIKRAVKFDPGTIGEESSSEGDAEGEEEEEEMQPTRQFKVLLKGRGNKTTAKQIQIPVTAEFVRALEDQEEARKREKELTKLHTLNQARRIEEEELAAEQKEIRNMSFTTKRKRGGGQSGQQGGQQQFQHQKGAPATHQFYGGWS